MSTSSHFNPQNYPLGRVTPILRLRKLRCREQSVRGKLRFKPNWCQSRVGIHVESEPFTMTPRPESVRTMGLKHWSVSVVLLWSEWVHLLIFVSIFKWAHLLRNTKGHFIEMSRESLKELIGCPNMKLISIIKI